MKKSDSDKLLIIGAGITLVHAMEAANELASAGINARVIDPFTIKPLDKEGIIANAKAAGGKIITVEDHYPEGKVSPSYPHVMYKVYTQKLTRFNKICNRLVRMQFSNFNPASFPGGIGDAVCSAVSSEPSISVHKLAVNGLPRSGPSAALLDMFGISSKHIVALAKKIA